MKFPGANQMFVGCDHAGLDLKRYLMKTFASWPWEDLGTHSADSVDYPDFANAVCEAMHPHLPGARGLLICGSGQGMAIRANRFPYIRAALCLSEDMARLAREHNDANVLCLGARLTEPRIAEKIFTTFLSTEFGGGRHQRRVNKL